MTSGGVVDARFVGVTRCGANHPALRISYEYYGGANFYCDVIRRARCLRCAWESVASLNLVAGGSASAALRELIGASKSAQSCAECGRSVAWGSGFFVNRVPILDDYKTRVDCGRPFPAGEWICGACDEAMDRAVAADERGEV